MIKITTEQITCTDAFKCSDIQVKKLELSTGLTLHKNKETDPKPAGSVSILHIQNKHVITLETY